MPVIRSHHEHDPWRPRLAWRADDVVQWGHPERPWGTVGEAFFEVFPREGGYVRGEGASTEDAEAACHAKAVRHRDCAAGGGHAWSRKFDHGLGRCRICNASQMVFQPIVNPGTWKEPLWLYELDSVFSGHLEPVDHPELATKRRDRSARRTWLRFRLHGIDLPEIPVAPKDILERTPFQEECEAIILETLRAGGGLAAFEARTLVLDGRLVARLERGISGLKHEYGRWEAAGFPDRHTASAAGGLEP